MIIIISYTCCTDLDSAGASNVVACTISVILYYSVESQKSYFYHWQFHFITFDISKNRVSEEHCLNRMVVVHF